MLLVLDNYDSFTFNLVQYLGELAADHPWRPACGWSAMTP